MISLSMLYVLCVCPLDWTVIKCEWEWHFKYHLNMENILYVKCKISNINFEINSFEKLLWLLHVLLLTKFIKLFWRCTMVVSCVVDKYLHYHHGEGPGALPHRVRSLPCVRKLEDVGVEAGLVKWSYHYQGAPLIILTPTVLYCTVLYCTVLYCTVLYCTALYCTWEAG